VAGKTVFAGFNEDMAPLRACVDIFTLPSLESEGLPRSILEAMALARPVVLTAVDGNRETVINGESGFLVPPGDVAALGEKLALLCADRNLRDKMGAAACARQRKFFEISAITREIEEVYEGLLQ
ncbi:MAG TPA: glycosyltransferase, partial [Elusimicrobiales bacterium]|nr:glycosyltransferase [Elusimicrobiales bacterium]